MEFNLSVGGVEVKKEARWKRSREILVLEKGNRRDEEVEALIHVGKMLFSYVNVVVVLFVCTLIAETVLHPLCCFSHALIKMFSSFSTQML